MEIPGQDIQVSRSLLFQVVSVLQLKSLQTSGFIPKSKLVISSGNEFSPTQLYRYFLISFLILWTRYMLTFMSSESNSPLDERQILHFFLVQRFTWYTMELMFFFFERFRCSSFKKYLLHNITVHLSLHRSLLTMHTIIISHTSSVNTSLLYYSPLYSSFSLLVIFPNRIHDLVCLLPSACPFCRVTIT